MLKRGDKGPAVVAVQEKLLALGYPLPRYGADGGLGGESVAAMSDFLRDHFEGVDEDRNVFTDVELGVLEQVYVGRSAIALPTGPELFYDLRNESNRKNDKGPRPWTQVTGITLHQTACLFAETRTRMINVGAHVVTGRGGGVWHLHDFDRVVWHANLFNRGDVGIEMNGLYPGLIGKLETVWNDPSTPKREMPHTVTDALVEVSVAACHWISETVALHGGRIRFIHAHRQTSADRPSDPGEELWERVGMRVIKELKLTYGPIGYKVHTGKPIPEQWDPAAKGIKY